MSAIESLANAAIGLVVSWAATVWILGYQPTQAAGVTAMFFVLSFARSFVLRELFRRAAK